MPEEVKPLRKANIKVEDIGKEAVLYSSDQKAIHVLNPTARLIWDLCDGNHTIAQMAQEIKSHFAVPAGYDVIADIRRTLETFAAKNILEEGGQTA